VQTLRTLFFFKECSSMTPQHHVDPQKTPFPYDIIISKSKIRAGDSVDVVIKGKSSQV
jgi:Reeler domain